MNQKTFLMGSVSVVALAAVVQAAQAQDNAVPEGYSVSVEGGLLFGKNTVANTVAEDKLGSGPSGGVVEIQDNMGYRAAIGLGKQVDPFWDLRVKGALNHQMESTSTFGSAGPSEFGEVVTDFDYETLDFEAGYRPQLTDKFEVRLFGGLRGLHYNDAVDKTGYEGGEGPGFGIEANYSAEFLGVGPRVGIEASTMLGESMFGISGMVAGAAILGTERTSTAASIFSGGSSMPIFVDSEEEFRSVFNLEAALGLDVHVTDSTTLTLGYRAEGIFGVSSVSGSSGGDSRFSHGPTIKLEADF